jgi:hypothetical protein
MFRLARNFLSCKGKTLSAVLFGFKFVALLILVAALIRYFPIHETAFGFGIAMVPFLIAGLSWKKTALHF